jgi:mannosyltransferase OCH1-like enzyme
LEEDILGLFNLEEFKEYKHIYTSLKYPVSRADVARMMVLYIYGGVYLDLDFIGKRSLEGLIARYPYNRAMMVENTVCRVEIKSLMNGFFITEAKNTFFLTLFKGLMNRVKDLPQSGLNVVNTTGPRALYHIVLANKLEDEMYSYIIPTHLVIPHKPDGTLSNEALAAGPEDKYYVATIWKAGTSWSHAVINDIVHDIFKVFLIMVAALIFIYLLVFGWGKKFDL